MKKTLFAISAFAALLGFTACTNDNDELQPQQSGETVTINAFIENSTMRTALNGDDGNGYDVVWSEGDKFAIGTNEFTLSGGKGTTSGTFTGTATLTSGNEYTAYYPTTYDGTNWPALQTYAANNITGSPMKATFEYTTGAVPSLSFQNEGGILRLTVKGSVTVKCIIVNANELSIPITLDCGAAGVALTEDGVAFHIAMPASGADGYTGVSIKLINTDSKVCTKKLNGDGLKIERSMITKASFTAASEKFVAPLNINDYGYVKLAGYYWATENVGEVADVVLEYNGGSGYGCYYVQSEAFKAAASWGGTWTLPTAEQWSALLDENKCDWAWQTGYSFGGKQMSGYLVTDKSDVSKFIFLPAGGFSWKKANPSYVGSYGQYWSSRVNTNMPEEHKGTLLSFEGGAPFVKYDQNELTGFLVRPVAGTLPTSGTAKAIIGGESVEVPWVQLWENGPKFAEYNVGVTDAKEESYGGYYTWGGTVDQDSEKAYWNGEKIDGHDTATKLWGNKWRMPTIAELEALTSKDKCTCTWTTNYNNSGKNGLLFTGIGDYSSNSVFLPAAGVYNGSDSFIERDRSGYYWSSTPNGNNVAYALIFDISGYLETQYGYGRNFFHSVRAVLADK